MKRFIITALITALLLQNVSAPLLSQASEVTEETTTENILTETSSVISEELQEAFLTEAESYRVMIWLEDIDYEKVETMVEKTTATTWEEIESYEKQVYSEAVTEVARAEMEEAGVMTAATLRTEEEIMADSYTEVLAVADEELKMVAEEVDSFIMAKRSASTVLYAENNKAIASNSLIKGNIEFVSRYSPMVIAELSREQIEAIAEEEGVVGIYLLEEEEFVDDETSETSLEQVSLSVSATDSTCTDYDCYLDYINASSAHSMGLTGEGVKVGLMDKSSIDSSGHQELIGANIVSIGLATNAEHSVNMARVICGTYGVAPDCELRSITRDSFYDGVETLIDYGASVINMSFGKDRGSNYYTDREMWLEHVSASHSVIVVKSAGNYDGDDYPTYNVSDPGLAYNTITVANVNCHNDELAEHSCYINYSTGAMKPDVSSSGSYVLHHSGGGTSAAAATVTGMIAILMEAKPTLVGAPHTVKAIVIASADHIAGSTTYASSYDTKQGAGVVDVMRAITIINRGQYLGNYISSNGNYSFTKNVVSGSDKSTFVFVGTKMNVGTGNHGEDEYSNQDMPTVTMVVFNSSGMGLSGSGMPNSSVQLVRTAYNSSVEIRLTVNNVGTRGLPYAIAWY